MLIKIFTHYIFILFCFLIYSCKKDQADQLVNKKYTFTCTTVGDSSDPSFTGCVQTVHFESNGTAIFILGDNTAYSATYIRSNNIVTVTVSNNAGFYSNFKLELIIISSTELREKGTDRIWQLGS